MATNISIYEALESDIPDMISVYCDAMEADVLTGFLFGHRRIEAVQKQTESLMTSLGRRFTHPTNRCHIHKAVDSQTGKLVGWSLVRWEDGKLVVPEDSSSDNEDFLTHYRREVIRNWLEISKGEPHVVLGGLYVSTDWHGHGIGTQLVNHLYSKYDLNNDPVIVQTRAMSEGFYTKLGWTTIVSTDVDLSEWKGQGMGYGLHRSPQMLRSPKS